MPVIIVGVFLTLFGIGQSHRDAKAGRIVEQSESQIMRERLSDALQAQREGRMMQLNSPLKRQAVTNGVKIPAYATRYSDVYIGIGD